MWRTLRPALSFVVVSTMLLGVVYPLGLCAIAAGLADDPRGRVVVVDDRVVGVVDVGQHFRGPQWLQGRPSALSTPYDARTSGGSNLGPAHPSLRARIVDDVARWQSSSAASSAVSVPIDLVTTSASGLDPHVSPEAARLQVPGIAAARGLSTSTVQQIVDDATEDRWLGVFGEPRVNVLRVNLALHARRPGDGATPAGR